MAKSVVKGFGEIAKEMGEETLKQGGEIAKGVVGGVAGVDWVSDIKTMPDEELEKKKKEDEERKKRELSGLGRRVEGEIEGVRREKKKKEEEEEERFLQEVQQKREAEARERQAMAAMNLESSNPAKRKKSRGSAMARGKKKASNSDMSATSEFSKKPD